MPQRNHPLQSWWVVYTKWVCTRFYWLHFFHTDAKGLSAAARKKVGDLSRSNSASTGESLQGSLPRHPTTLCKASPSSSTTPNRSSWGYSAHGSATHPWKHQNGQHFWRTTWLWLTFTGQYHSCISSPPLTRSWRYYLLASAVLSLFNYVLL